MKKQLEDLIEYLQIIFGYLLMWSILKVLLFFIEDIYVLAWFGVCIILIEIKPHTTSKLNPFAFNADYRYGLDKW